MGESRSLISPLLVGRDDLLQLVDERVGEAEAGHGGLLVLAGEPGIGKTRLLLSALRKAESLGFRVAKGEIAPQDRLVPLASITDLARSMRYDAPAAFGGLGERLLGIEGGKGADALASRRLLVRDIADTVASSVTRPTLLAFEDLQWADEMSLEVVGELARLARGRRLLLVATYRLDELPVGSIHREWRARLLTQRLAHEVHLERLTRDETALVTTLLLGTGLPAPREVVDAIHQRSDGIPLHVEELVAAVARGREIDGGAVLRATVPDSIEDAILARTARLSDDARAVARAGAVIGRSFLPDVLAGVMNRKPGELDGPLQELVDEAVLHPFAFVDEGYFDFRHQLLRDVLYRSVPLAELRRLHARAGEFGARLAGANEIHASLHFERAGMREEAYRAALAGAEAASAKASRYEAFELYRRAVENVPEGLPATELASLYDNFCAAAFAVDDVAAIASSAEQARRHQLAAGRPVDAAWSLINVAGMYRRDVRPRAERIAILDRAEAELAALPASSDRSMAMSDLRTFQAILALDVADFDLARARLVDARSLALESTAHDVSHPLASGDMTEGVLLDLVAGIDYLDAMADALSGRVGPGLDAMLETAKRARDANLESAGVTAYRTAAGAALRLMDYARADIGLREGLRYADAVEQSYCLHVMAAASAVVAWASGRWDEAVATAELEMVERGSRRGTLGSRQALAFVAFGRGEIDRARVLLGEALRISRPAAETELDLPSLWALAETELLADNPVAAIAACEDAFAEAAPTGERALLVPFIVTGVRAALVARTPEAGQVWLDRIRPLMAGWDEMARPGLEHAEGLLQTASGATVAARALLESAIRGWDGRPRTWEATTGRLDLAACLIRGNRPADAIPVLAEVRTTARRLGSPMLLERAEALERLARSHGGKREAWHPLTIREFEVARHIAAGRTNNEIADELTLSPKTVSAHVEHILAKLGASRRAEIAAWVSTIAVAVTA